MQTGFKQATGARFNATTTGSAWSVCFPFSLTIKVTSGSGYFFNDMCVLFISDYVIQEFDREFLYVCWSCGRWRWMLEPAVKFTYLGKFMQLTCCGWEWIKERRKLVPTFQSATQPSPPNSSFSCISWNFLHLPSFQFKDGLLGYPKTFFDKRSPFVFVTGRNPRSEANNPFSIN